MCGYLEEICFPVATPHKSGVNVIWNAGETNGDLLRITGRGDLVPEAPIQAALEEERFAVRPCERGVDVIGQTRPIVPDSSRIA